MSFGSSALGSGALGASGGGSVVLDALQLTLSPDYQQPSLERGNNFVISERVELVSQFNQPTFAAGAELQPTAQNLQIETNAVSNNFGHRSTPIAQAIAIEFGLPVVKGGFESQTSSLDIQIELNRPAFMVGQNGAASTDQLNVAGQLPHLHVGNDLYPHQLELMSVTYAPALFFGRNERATQLNIAIEQNTGAIVVGQVHDAAQCAILPVFGAPTVALGNQRRPSGLELVVGGLQPTLSLGYRGAAEQSFIEISSDDPSNEFGESLHPSALEIETFGQTPEVIAKLGYQRSPTVAEIAIEYEAGTATLGHNFEAEQQTLIIEGFRPSLNSLSVDEPLVIEIEGLTPTIQTGQAYRKTAIALSLNIGLRKPNQTRTAHFPPVAMEAYYDSAGFEIEQDNPAASVTMEGGYKVTRPKYLRRPRRNYTIAFKDISQADKQILEQFWREYRGGTDTFTLSSPTGGGDITVKFSAPMKFNYRGMGDNRRWDVTGIKVTEV